MERITSSQQILLSEFPLLMSFMNFLLILIIDTQLLLHLPLQWSNQVKFWFYCLLLLPTPLPHLRLQAHHIGCLIFEWSLLKTFTFRLLAQFKITHPHQSAQEFKPLLFLYFNLFEYLCKAQCPRGSIIRFLFSSIFHSPWGSFVFLLETFYGFDQIDWNHIQQFHLKEFFLHLIHS